MKKRNFYPRQVLQKLDGMKTDNMSESQVHALRFFMLRSRKYNLMISLLQDSPCATEIETKIDVARLSLRTLQPHLRVFVRPLATLATLDIPGACPSGDRLQIQTIEISSP